MNTGASYVVRLPSDCVKDIKCIGLRALLNLLQGTGGTDILEENESGNLEGIGLKTTPELDVGTGNTYTYSVRDLRSQRERYIRAAPIDLRSSGQDHQTLTKSKTMMTHRIATMMRVREIVSVRAGV
jgi:hypothetical protein